MLLHTHYGRVYAAIWMPRFQENCVESGVKADLEPRTSNATGTCQDLLVAEKNTRIGNRTPRFEIAGKAKCVVFFCFLLWPPVAGSNSSLLLHPFANCKVSLAPCDQDWSQSLEAKAWQFTSLATRYTCLGLPEEPSVLQSSMRPPLWCTAGATSCCPQISCLPSFLQCEPTRPTNPFCHQIESTPLSLRTVPSRHLSFFCDRTCTGESCTKLSSH